MAAQPTPIASMFVWLTVFGLLLAGAPAKAHTKGAQDTPLSELSAHDLASSLLALDGRAAQAAPSFKIFKSWDLPGALGSGFHLISEPSGLRQPKIRRNAAYHVRRLCVVGMIELRI